LGHARPLGRVGLCVGAAARAPVALSGVHFTRRQGLLVLRDRYVVGEDADADHGAAGVLAEPGLDTYRQKQERRLVAQGLYERLRRCGEPLYRPITRAPAGGSERLRRLCNRAL
jgi:hypothetical protein